MTARTPGLVLGLAAAVPGWAVRGLAPLLVLVCAATVQGGAVVWTLAGSVAAAVAARPDLPVAPFLPLLAGTWVVGGPDLLTGGPLDVARLALLVLATHLAVRFAALAAHVAWLSRVEVAVLRRVVAGVLRVQVVVQQLLVGVWALRGLVDGATSGVLRWVAVPAVVVLALLVLPRGWVRR